MRNNKKKVRQGANFAIVVRSDFALLQREESVARTAMLITERATRVY